MSREGELSLLSHRFLCATLLCVGSSCVTGNKAVLIFGTGIQINPVASERCQGDRAQGCYEKGLELAARAVTIRERTVGVDLIFQACGARTVAACNTLRRRLKPPEPLSGRTARYTLEATYLELSGTVVIKCVMTAEGKLRDCEIHSSHTLKHRELLRVSGLEAEIFETLSTWRFTSALFDGQPCEIEYGSLFVLNPKGLDLPSGRIAGPTP